MATTRRRKKTTTRKKTVRRTKRAKTTTRRLSTSGKKGSDMVRISFKGHRITLEKLFGKTPTAPHAVAHKLWAYVNKKKLAYIK